MSLKRSMLKTLAMLAMESTMTADKIFILIRDCQMKGWDSILIIDAHRLLESWKNSRLKDKRSVHTQEKMQSKDLKQEGNYETDSRSSDWIRRIGY